MHNGMAGPLDVATLYVTARTGVLYNLEPSPAHLVLEYKVSVISCDSAVRPGVLCFCDCVAERGP